MSMNEGQPKIEKEKIAIEPITKEGKRLYGILNRDAPTNTSPAWKALVFGALGLSIVGMIPKSAEAGVYEPAFTVEESVPLPDHNPYAIERGGVAESEIIQKKQEEDILFASFFQAKLGEDAHLEQAFYRNGEKNFLYITALFKKVMESENIDTTDVEAVHRAMNDVHIIQRVFIPEHFKDIKDNSIIILYDNFVRVATKNMA